jgi:sugar lactone lactonase YvrE
MKRLVRPLSIATLAFLAAAVRSEMAAAESLHRAGDRDSSGARCIAVVSGLGLPETAVFDARRGMFLISEIVGGPTTKDGNGRILAVGIDGRRQEAPVVVGGAAGATLHAPKGMLLIGDTLWVADIDAVRAFHRRTGAPITSIDLAPHGAVFLNDLDRHPDGTLYVTDTGLRFDDQGPHHDHPDRVWRVRPTGVVDVALQGDSLGWLNGIAWDASARRFVIVQLNGRSVLGWVPGDTEPRVIAQGPGGYDGVDVLKSGNLLVSSQDGSGMFLLRDGTAKRLVGGLGAVGNHGFDPRSRRVAVPRFDHNSVEIWELPAALLK